MSLRLIFACLFLLFGSANAQSTKSRLQRSISSILESTIYCPPDPSKSDYYYLETSIEWRGWREQILALVIRGFYRLDRLPPHLWKGEPITHNPLVSLFTVEIPLTKTKADKRIFVNDLGETVFGVCFRQLNESADGVIRVRYDRFGAPYDHQGRRHSHLFSLRNELSVDRVLNLVNALQRILAEESLP